MLNPPGPYWLHTNPESHSPLVLSLSPTQCSGQVPSQGIGETSQPSTAKWDTA